MAQVSVDPQDREERNLAMVAERDSGDTYRALAERYGITQGRARQIVWREYKRRGIKLPRKTK